jgi:hypothetical protein
MTEDSDDIRERKRDLSPACMRLVDEAKAADRLIRPGELKAALVADGYSREDVEFYFFLLDNSGGVN